MGTSTVHCTLASSIPIVSQPANPVSARNDALDFIKGFLVFGMIVFHAINYFALTLWPVLPYLRFVSAGFIFISGYIVATFSATKWAHDPARVTTRLVIRALKLIALFTVINLAINALAVRNFNTVEYGLDQFADRAFDIYFIGGGRYAAFEILLPIGYLLFVSPVILWILRRRTIAFCAAVFLAASMLLLRLHLDNFGLLLVGVGGMVVGRFLPPDRIASRAHFWVSLTSFFVVIAFLPWLRHNTAGFVVYIGVVLKCVADASIIMPADWFARKVVTLCGENVLFCYLTHITILQAIFRLAWPERESSILVLAMIVVVTAVLMLLCSVMTTAIRRQFTIVDRAYRFVFA